MDEEKLEQYIIPENYNGKFYFMNIAVQNLIEAGIASLVVGRLILMIPFLIKIKVSVLVLCCLLTFAFFAFGIKGESVITFVIGYLSFLINRKIYVFRRPDITYGVLKEKQANEKSEGEYTSYYERTKEKFKNFKKG